MTCEDAQRLQCDVFPECCSGIFEKFIENLAHREDRRSRVQAYAIDVECTQLPAGATAGFHNHHLKPTHGQVYGGSKSADPGADNDHPMGSQKALQYSQYKLSIFIDIYNSQLNITQMLSGPGADHGRREPH